ncbi:MAG: AAA family ATPase [Pseudomonadota bacterium]
MADVNLAPDDINRILVEAVAKETPLRIVKFSAEDVLRLKAVQITPTGDLVVIGGGNDAGKSSVLNAIEMAMAGAGAAPEEPVRRGRKAGKVVVDLGEILVTLTVGRNTGRKLVVTAKDGTTFKSPQALLDGLWSTLTGDPLAFERMQGREQAETLRTMVGLDVSDLEAGRARLYEERTQVNRTVDALKVKVDQSFPFEGAPTEEVSVAALVEELAEAARLAQDERNAAARISGADAALRATQAEIETLRQRLAMLEARAEQEGDQAVTAAMEYQEAVALVKDEAAIRARLSASEEVNAQVRTNRQRAQAEQALDAARADAAALTDKIREIDQAKADRLAAVQFPVDGLGIDDDGLVTLDGLPFSQASTSDRIRASVAIALARKPRLRVLLVRDGSLLGPAKLEILAQMAKEAGAQVWLEMLQEEPDSRTTVFIEDGTVRP